LNSITSLKESLGTKKRVQNSHLYNTRTGILILDNSERTVQTNEGTLVQKLKYSFFLTKVGLAIIAESASAKLF